MEFGLLFIIGGGLVCLIGSVVLAGTLMMMSPKPSLQTPAVTRKPPTDLVRRFDWVFPTQPALAQPFAPARFSVKLSISRARYEWYCRQAERSLSPYCFDSYVTPASPEVRQLAHKLQELGRQQGFLAYDLLCFTLAFVQQSINYAHDVSPKTNQIVEYPKYPIETLAEKTGDCEDQAILIASLLKNMGFDVALLILPTHVALGVAGFVPMAGVALAHPATGKRYYYTETTVHGWLPGQVPEEFMPDIREGTFDILPIVDPAGSELTLPLHDDDAYSGQQHSQPRASSNLLT